MSDHLLPPDLSAAHDAPDRNLALELVRVTEAAAMAAASAALSRPTRPIMAMMWLPASSWFACAMARRPMRSIH